MLLLLLQVRQLDTAYQAAVAKFEMEHNALNVHSSVTISSSQLVHAICA
jgi:hypothetical protein